MNNHIRGIELIDRRLSPAEAEVQIRVYLDRIPARTNLGGRLMGPSCRYASTVEVAYPLRPLSHGQSPPTVEARVIIPEPSLWDPTSPFLYQGPIELWQDGILLEQAVVCHGLRWRSMGTAALRWNGTWLPLNGWSGTIADESEMLALRSAGFNLLTVPGTMATAPLWEMADRIGFLLIGVLEGLGGPLASVLAKHPSCLGFALEPRSWAKLDAEVLRQFKAATNSFVGIELSAPTTELPPGADFALCDAPTGKTMANTGLPVLFRQNR